VFKGVVSSRDGTKVSVFAISPQRASFLLRAGTASHPNSPHAMLETALASRVLAAVLTGGEPTELRTGLRVGGETLEPLASGAVLVVDAQGKLRVVRAAPAADASDFIELPLLAEGDQLTAEAGQTGVSRRRAAICTSPDGFVWVAVTKATSGRPLVDALGRVRCGVIASLDRGDGKPARLFRAGTDSPPLDQYDRPALYVLGTDLATGAFPWKPEG
jgi:hypothetical protein